IDVAFDVLFTHDGDAYPREDVTRVVPLAPPDRAVRVPRPEVSLRRENTPHDAVLLEHRRLDLVRDRCEHDRSGVAQSGGDARRRRVQRRPPETPIRLALEFVARYVTHGDDVEHQTLKSTWRTSPSLTG